jgi:hypothetical protein
MRHSNMKTSPAIQQQLAPGGPAGSAAASSSRGDASGATDAEVQTEEETSSAQPAQADLIAAFVGDQEVEAEEEDGLLEEGTGATGAGAQGEEEETAETAEAAEEAEGTGATGTGQLSHLIDAIAKDPGNKESAAYKRATKLLGDAAARKQEIEKLRLQVKDHSGPPVVVAPEPTAADPLAHVKSESELTTILGEAQASQESAQAWVDWLTDNRDGGTPPVAGAKPMDAEEVRERLQEARALVREAARTLAAAPGKQEWLKQVKATRESLRTTNPELFEQDASGAVSPALAEVLEVIQSGAVNTRKGTYMQDAVDLVAGRKAREQKKAGVVLVPLKPGEGSAGKGQAAAVTKRPGASGGGGGGAVRAPGARPAGAGADLQELRKQSRAGNVKANAVLIDQFAG